jgi:excisionase family DNA binding protein
MHNLVFSPIDSEKLIMDISERVTANILSAVRNEKTTNGQSDSFLTIEGAAEMLHLSKSTIYSKSSKGEIPGVCKRGKRLFFSKNSLTEWIKGGLKKSNSELEKEAEIFTNSYRSDLTSSHQNN